MIKKSKQTEDINNKRNRAQSSIVDYSQSFASSTTKKFVNLSLPDVQIKGKQFYKKQPYCTICFKNYTTTFRQHHCRICSNAVCNDCSKSMVNKQRACDLCILKLSNPQEDRKKKQMLETLQTLCAYLVFRKKQKMEELQHLKNTEGTQNVEYSKEIKKQYQIIAQLQAQNKQLKGKKIQATKQLSELRQNNQKIQEQISKFNTGVHEQYY